MSNSPESLLFTDRFVDRHVGPNVAEVEKMLKEVGSKSLDAFIGATVPARIRLKRQLDLGAGRSEFEALRDLRAIAAKNEVFRSYIGMGYSGTITPPVIQRNVLENPGWYTQYTPYQSEISQGRLEALLNFQTMVIDLTGLPVSNASLLDEATAAAEAMTMCFGVKNRDVNRAFFVSEECHPQTIALLRTRAEPLGIQILVGNHRKFSFDRPIFGALVQYPATDGAIYDYTSFGEKVHKADAMFVVAADILALTVLKSPGELGADIAVGSTQRLGVPLGYGGPHAGYMSAKDEFKRVVPGRIIGLSQDADGQPAARLALQTREQHIRREKATSNICTAQVLLAVIASMYAVYHGPKGLRRIADRVNLAAKVLAEGLKRLGLTVGAEPFFDTVRVELGSISKGDLLAAARAQKINLRFLGDKTVTVALDETVTAQDLRDLFQVFARGAKVPFAPEDLATAKLPGLPAALERRSAYLTHPVFNSYHSETELLRYIHRLQGRDLSLTHSMIPLGSCTMKLNATAEMFPVTWPELGQLHPFVPVEQAKGYQVMFGQLESWLAEITGFDAVSLQPNAGSQGEYAGLLAIRRYHQNRGEGHRDVCLIPQSAHGTNPASAAMVGMRVVVVQCTSDGNVDLADLRAKAEQHSRELSCAMITYPSTHGVFEETITEFCDILHKHGGQVYMDGANMNAQVGLCRPGDFGPDVCHLNLHKTFCIPHGGGGPGMGPIGVKAHLKSFLPSHPIVSMGGDKALGPVSAAPWGSASILPISWMYIAMMGSEGLKRATEIAILNANYVAKRLDAHYPVLYKGSNGFVAHECIIDMRKFKATTGVEVEDVAKRLMDYGFHAPTISFPVAGTMMIEPTESESLAELDRFCEAMILIRKEIAEIEEGKADKTDNVLKNAPHTAARVTKTEWTHSYTREKAAYPAPWTRTAKFWPPVARVNNVLGDRNLVCACPPIEAYA
ncbi:MAG: aminomethyl-transferring glycine dehydrogenase [Deltaproteobacteria bacterium]|nr:aminomethyl-transferring glycine dehydrogenase [Deltaproteobacteria bacterium]